MPLWRATAIHGWKGANINMPDIQILPDAAALARAAADHVVMLAAGAIAERQRFSLGLSGGSTPSALFTLLASAGFAGRIDWNRVHVFWGDERCVPPDHPDSNYRMARETLLDHVPLPEANIHRMHGEMVPAQAAADYERDLQSFFGADDLPRFDLLLQGLGDDGHTASLFPGTTALHERKRRVVENYVPRLGAWRITLTVPVINAAANVVFLVEGAKKSGALRAVLQGPYQPDVYPSQFIQPVDGRLLWLVNQDAAAQLDGG